MPDTVIVQPVVPKITVQPVTPQVTAASPGPQGPPGTFSGNLVGTANQVIITPSGNTYTFSTPQDIATTSAPTFERLILNPNLFDTGLTIKTARPFGISAFIDIRDNNSNYYGGIDGNGYFVQNNPTTTEITSIQPARIDFWHIFNQNSTNPDISIVHTTAGVLNITDGGSGYGSLTCGSPTIGTPGLTIQQIASQTAHSFEVIRSDGVPICYFDPAIGLRLANTYALYNDGVLLIQTAQGGDIQICTQFTFFTDNNRTANSVVIYGGSAATNQCIYVNPPVVSSKGIFLQGCASYTANYLEIQDSGNNVLTQIDSKGAWHPPSVADSAAQNNSIYYSTTANKLVYKDNGGGVNSLY